MNRLLKISLVFALTSHAFGVESVTAQEAVATRNSGRGRFFANAHLDLENESTKQELRREVELQTATDLRSRGMTPDQLPGSGTDSSVEESNKAGQPFGAEILETLQQINQRFEQIDVELVEWPDSLHKKLGKLKKIAFMAYPVNRPAGKLPLLITLHGGGGRNMSLQKQLERSADVKGLALAELAGRDLILLEPNSADTWEADSLNTMLDYILEKHPEIDRKRIYVMGHSMGGWGTWSWINESAGRFAAAAPCGFPADESGDPKRLVKLPIWGMAGGSDGERTAGVKKMVERLRAAGNVNVRHTEFSGANHSKANAAVFSSVELVDWMLGFSKDE